MSKFLTMKPVIVPPENMKFGVTTAYLGELFNVVGNEIAPLGRRLPESERTLVLLLADLCYEATRSLDA